MIEIKKSLAGVALSLVLSIIGPDIYVGEGALQVKSEILYEVPIEFVFTRG